MPTIDVVVGSNIELTTRARQVCGMFDCPPEEKQRIEWKYDLPIEEEDWSIGLIVGPSGCGKTTIARHLWPDSIDKEMSWDKPSVIDCFTETTVEETAKALNSVGFSTIPAWLRPYHVLSNGEKFRADIARRVAEQSGIIVIDEFTSVVDRQIAKIASHSVQKYIRKSGRQLVAVSCHEDIIDWLQPDWVFRPSTGDFTRRSVRPRPSIKVEMARIPIEAWRLFAPFHYMSADIHKGAACYGLWANDQLACFAAVLHRPHPKTKNLKGISRMVTHPDYQGVGLAFVAMEALGAAYNALGYRLRAYPAHPSFARAFRHDRWSVGRKGGGFPSPSKKTNADGTARDVPLVNHMRPCWGMDYIGPRMPKDKARKLIETKDF